jgi:hypothetical protein
MTKFAIGLIGLTLVLYACSDKKELIKTSTTFTSFEIGYTNGWTRGTSFWVDSNKIFLSPQKFDTVKYGLLPDSIVRLIDTTLLKIISDTSIKSKDDGCVDCSIVAMQTIIGKDTITIHQIGNINKVFWPVIKTLEKFIDSVNHPTMPAKLFLESQRIAFPPPLPPTSNERKFLPPDK